MRVDYYGDCSAIRGRDMNAQKLKENVRALPYLETLRPGPAGELLREAPPAESWPTYVNHLKDLILAGDPHRFQQWRIITDTMMGTGMAVGHSLEYLKARPDWHGRWLPLITDGHGLFHRTTALIHAYYIAQLEERTGVCISDLAFVLEFGGGFGNMCHLFHKLGFKGSYVLFDFPVLLALQEFYLTEMGVSATYISEPGNLPALDSPSLFVATFSLSEAPHSIRQPFKAWAPGFDSFLITYSTGGPHAVMENEAYFQAWRDDMPHKVWDSWRMHFTRSGWGLVGGKPCTTK